MLVDDLKKVMASRFSGEVYAFVKEEPWEVEQGILNCTQELDQVCVVDLRDRKLTDSTIAQTMEKSICGYSHYRVDVGSRYDNIQSSIISRNLKGLIVLGVERVTPEQFASIEQFREVSIHGSYQGHLVQIFIVCSAKKLARLNKRIDRGIRIMKHSVDENQ